MIQLKMKLIFLRDAEYRIVLLVVNNMSGVRNQVVLPTGGF